MIFFDSLELDRIEFDLDLESRLALDLDLSSFSLIISTFEVQRYCRQYSVCDVPSPAGSNNRPSCLILPDKFVHLLSATNLEKCRKTRF